jgi:hypothetical protein
MNTKTVSETFRAKETFFTSSIFDNKQLLGEIVQDCHARTAKSEVLFFLLVSHFDKLGIRNFIVNHLFEIDVREVLFYLPQFCYMNVVIPNTAIEKFLIARCPHSTEFFILVE